jgi:hypothetical protein
MDGWMDGWILTSLQMNVVFGGRKQEGSNREKAFLLSPIEKNSSEFYKMSGVCNLWKKKFSGVMSILRLCGQDTLYLYSKTHVFSQSS